MPTPDARRSAADRRHAPRGGRRTTDRPGRAPLVLVAESYDGVRDCCSRYLERFNFHVLQASDGEQALAHIAAGTPRVIITERDLPAMPATRLAQRLSQSWRTRSIPVIVLEAGFDPPAGLQEGAAGVLVKPFSLSRMLAEIRRVLRASRAP
jgi:DNA-binding response OmpR family regulator